MRTIEWRGGEVSLIDQTLLPMKFECVICKNYEEIAEAIEKMKIRGAPAIGVAAAMGIALAAYNSKANTKQELLNDLKKAEERIKSTRPTAVNLFWAIDRMMKLAKESNENVKEIILKLVKEANLIAEEDIKINKAIGENGEKLIEDGDVIGTICNAGALATVDYGTALGVIRSAWNKGKKIKVIAMETRPFFQGARLTSWELKKDGIPVTVITDNSIGLIMQKGMINKMIVGADRILKDGSVFNKIGTYTAAVLAKNHNIPFYVAAPLSTIDLYSKPQDIIIEQRDPKEVYDPFNIGYRIVPENVEILNFAFDYTPSEYVSAIITEKGVAYPPFINSIIKLFKS